MSEQGTTGPIANVDADSPRATLSKLVELARLAHQQKSTKDCLDLTRAILLIDPENAEAQLMRSSIRSELRVDLENARALLNASRNDIAVREAADNPVPTISEPDQNEAEDVSKEAESTAVPTPEVSEEIPRAIHAQPVSEAFFAGPGNEKKPWFHKIKTFKRAGTLVVVGLVAVGVPIFRSKSNPVEIPVSAPAAKPNTKTVPPAVQDNPQTMPAEAVSESASAALIADNRSNTLFPVAERNRNTRDDIEPPEWRDQSSIASPSGTLAVSSLISTDIYIEGQYVGSTPVTLQISEGTHTVEYRHAQLRKTLAHVIKGNETTRAMVTFDVAISINAKPWAHVFLDGIEKKSLGQTPLSEVRVPVGGVLLFENPQFEGKQYRITGNETGVQIVFP